jgi:hypothetical protein
VASIDLALLRCFCGPGGPVIGTAETLVSMDRGIPLIEAHKLFCAFEDYLDKALDMDNEERQRRFNIANASDVDHSKTWEQIEGL